MSAIEAAARKATPRPLSGFCCGCSLDVGVKVITITHLLINALVLAAIFNDVIGKTSNFAIWYENDLTLAMMLSGWTLCGILFSLCGFWGTFVKSETIVRVYWFYALASYIIMTGFVIKDLVLSGPCESIPVLFNGVATAVTCGVFRVVNTVVVMGLVFIPMYFLFVVLSYCDNIAYGQTGPGFQDLAPGSDKFYRPWLYQKEPQQEISEYLMSSRGQGTVNAPGGYGNPNRGGGYGAIYEQAASQGLGGSRPILNSSGYHDMNYPRGPTAA